MKRNSTQLCVRVSLVLTTLSLIFSQKASAHNVRFYTPPCFTQGSNVTIPVVIGNAGNSTYYHWQFRVPGGSWTYLSNGNNTINGRVFSMANASFNNATSNNNSNAGAPLSPAFTISNVGSPAYTTQLDNVEFRVLMTDGQDPLLGILGTNIWGGVEFLNGFEAKYVRLNSKPAGDNCYSNCNGNALVNSQASSTIENYYGGFEAGANFADNFSTPASNGSTSKAYSDLPVWSGGSLTGAMVGIINNPDTMNSLFTAIAPHSGRRMMVVSNLTNNNSRIWYRTIAVPTSSSFYNGVVTVKAWFAKIDLLNSPSVKMNILGSTAATGSSFSQITSNGPNSVSAATAITGFAGNWVQKTFTYTVPAGTYKRLEISIVTSNASSLLPLNFAVDDICLNEPSASGTTLPVILTGLKGTYTNGVAHLSWSTEQEMNSNYFEVERSTDGTNFSTTGKIYAAGNSSTKLNYSFNDIKVNNGTNYYRLRMVDKDGSFQYSNVIVINVTIKGINIAAIYPTPFTHKVNVAIASETVATANIRLLDNTGKTLVKKQAPVSKGLTTITLEHLEGLANGFYIIEVQSGETVATQKLMK